MTDAVDMKADLLGLLGLYGRAQSFDETQRAQLETLVESLVAKRPCLAGERPDLVAGSWQTEFASFGVKHSIGKNQVHDSDLALQSFNRLPKVPVKVLNLIQEIDPVTQAYNNVVSLTPLNGDLVATLIVHGRYRLEPEDMVRFHVAFSAVSLNAKVADSDLRKAFGLAVDAPLKVSLEPPKLWSDIVYVDANLRINRGNFGGLYVLTKREEPAISI